MRLDLRNLAGLAWRERRWLLSVHAAVAAVTVAVVLLLPRWYAASVTLVPAPNDGLTLDLAGLGASLPGGSLSLSGAPTPQDQLTMVVQSRAVADSLIRRFDLVRAWKLRRRDQARERLAELTTVTTPKEGQVIVTIEARTPVLARALAAEYARRAATESIRLKTSLARQRRAYLEARLAELENEITAASRDIRAFEETHGAIALPEQTRETMEAGATLQAQVALFETELAAARRYFTDQSPQVVALTERIAELRRQIDRLARKGGTLLIQGSALPALKQEYLRLTRHQLSLTAVSELLRRLYEQARVEEANPVPTFSTLDDAELPERHSRPRRAATVLVAQALCAAALLTWLHVRPGKPAAPVRDPSEPEAPEAQAA